MKKLVVLTVMVIAGVAFATHREISQQSDGFTCINRDAPAIQLEIR